MLNNYYYDNLNQKEKSVYRSVLTVLNRSGSKCSITGYGLKDSEADNIVRAVFKDHPEIINCPGTIYFTSSSDIKFYYAEVDYDGYNKKINKIAEELNKKLSSDSSDYVVARAIYDYLCTTIKYDFEIREKYTELKHRNASSDEMVEFLKENTPVFTPYGIIMHNKGVCQGIAKAYKILCNMFGLQCACVIGKMQEDPRIEHMINVVEIDGKRVYADVTSGLATSDSGLGVINYDYFLVNEEVIRKRFIPDIEFKCTDSSLSYHVRNKLVLKSENDIRRFIDRYMYKSNDGVLRIRYDGKDMSDSALERFVNKVLLMRCREGQQFETNVNNGFVSVKIKR